MRTSEDRLRTREISERVCQKITLNELSFGELTELDGFSDIPEWQLILALRKLIYSNKVTETNGGNFQISND